MTMPPLNISVFDTDTIRLSYIRFDPAISCLLSLCCLETVRILCPLICGRYYEPSTAHPISLPSRFRLGPVPAD